MSTESHNSKSRRRFIFRTQGVCPPEIHFRLDRDRIRDIRFVGGGCPGNADLVARLLDGKTWNEISHQLQGIICRNQTSCPDQLATAVQAAGEGRLDPASPLRLETDPAFHRRLALIGELAGRYLVLERLMESIGRHAVDAVYCLGNLTGNSTENKRVLQTAYKNRITTVLGELDWHYGQGTEGAEFADLDPRQRHWLIRRPHVLRFSLRDKRGVAFFGDYLQRLPGYSDYDPFALEINMVCGLTGLMQDTSVFPALEAMIPQFQADIIVFSQNRSWGHWQLRGKEFISLGPAAADDQIGWGLLESGPSGVRFSDIREPMR